MKVERKGKKVFEPIIVTLETEEEAQYMSTIANICKDQTLEGCCKARGKDCDAVDGFGADLTNKLNTVLNDC